MQIDPKVEESARSLIGHAVRGELDKLEDLITALDPERFAECLSLYLRVAGYVAIDICGDEWPTGADVREIAGRMAAVGLDYDLAESDVYDYLARCALGFEPLTEVFADKAKVTLVPIFATAALLVSYRVHGKHWWDYLDLIEQSLETAAPLPEAVVPALLLLARRNRAARAGTAQASAPEA